MFRYFKLIALFVVFFGLEFQAQKTMIYTNEYRSFSEGQDLYDKEKYSAAQEKFGGVVKQITDKQDEVRINAEYYYAVCALELFHKDAEFLLERFVTEHPDHPKARTVYFQLGRYNYRLKRSKKVIEYLTKVDPFDLSPDERIELHFKLGYSYFKEDDYEKAKKHFFEIKDKESDYQTPSIYYYSHIAYTENNYQTALEGFQKIAHNPMFISIVPYYITQIYYKQEHYDDLLAYAPPYLDSVSKKRRAEFAKLIGDSYYFEKRYKEAIPFLMEFRKGAKATRNDNYQIGYCYYGTQNWENAVKYFGYASTKKDDLSQVSYYHMADAYLKLDEKDYARNAFRAASKLDFDDNIKENSLFNYAKLAYELSYNPFDEAIDAFQEYINTYPNSPHVDEAYEFLLKVYMTTRNYGEALKSLEKIKNKDNRMKVAYQTITFNRAVELFHNGNYQEAIERFKDVTTYPIDKRLNAESIYWTGEAYYKLKDYDRAIEKYVDFRLEPGAALTSVFYDADYNAGYSYFMKANPFESKLLTQEDPKKNEYLNKSITAFRNFVQLSNRIETKRLVDAYVRLGDCYYLTHDDKQAIEFYSEAIKNGTGDMSYAYYQKAKSQGYSGDNEGKAKTLQELTDKYPNSSYQIMSIRELALSYRVAGENDKAIATYKRFISDYPQNKYVPEAIVSIGGIYLTQQKYDNAEEYFLRVINDYPNATDQYESAIMQMKGVYEGRNDMDGYFNWLSSMGIEVDQNERDSTLWVPVQEAWVIGECEGITTSAESYLVKLPKGKHSLDANFYVAQCAYKNQELEKALQYYNTVIESVNNPYYEEAIRNAADISYDLKDYHQAAGYYATLEKIAVEEEDIRRSIINQMNSFYYLENYSSAKEYAIKVLELSPLDDPQKVNATLIKGICMKEMGEYTDAKSVLLACSKMTQSIKGAEAKYNYSEILYIEKDYENCQNSIMELVKQKPSYDYWIAKAIILLGDNFLALGDYFNAKHSLQSVVDNYEGPDQAELVRIAQEKLDHIHELENSNDKSFDKGPDEIDFNNVDDKDKDLFDDGQKNEEKDNNNEEPNNE